MPSPIIPVAFFKFLLCRRVHNYVKTEFPYYSVFMMISAVSVTMRSTVYLVADKWVYLVHLRLILPEILLNSS